jgi:hypothetical protein
MMLFIDAQQYLDLYRMHGGKSLLAPFTAVKDKVFITAQIVDEVNRNKVGVAWKFLSDEVFRALVQEFKAIGKGLPNHLFSAPVTNDLETKLKGIRDGIDGMRKATDKAIDDLLQQIGRSEDEVSRVLNAVFDRAVEVTDSELKRARARKERGSAPGKPENALGDQINWEQFLTCVEQWPQVWIISRDTDYCHKYAGAAVLNASLFRDLKQQRTDIVVHCFTEMEKGLRDFIKSNPISDAKLPPPDEAERINREQQSLPPLGWMDCDDGAAQVIERQQAAQRGWRAWWSTNSVTNPWDSVEGLPPPGRVE